MDLDALFISTHVDHDFRFKVGIDFYYVCHKIDNNKAKIH